ncbi:MAG: hypothetical protein GX675_06250 [Erysipelotrichaceae bacterium]|nr:hypothetical protein [Erysipelotrichaceae bacterium]
MIIKLSLSTLELLKDRKEAILKASTLSVLISRMDKDLNQDETIELISSQL